MVFRVFEINWLNLLFEQIKDCSKKINWSNVNMDYYYYN